MKQRIAELTIALVEARAWGNTTDADLIKCELQRALEIQRAQELIAGKQVFQALASTDPNGFNLN